HLIAPLAPGGPQRRLKRDAGRPATDDAVAAVGAEDPVRPAAELRPVDEEVREGGLAWRRFLPRRNQLEQRPRQLLDAEPCRGRNRDASHYPFIVHLQGGRGTEEVDLVQDDDLRALVETRAVLGELAVDLPKLLGRVARRSV